VDRLNDMANKLSFIFRYYQTFSALPSNFGCTALSMVLGFYSNVSKNHRIFESMVYFECSWQTSNVRLELKVFKLFCLFSEEKKLGHF
jgi:hypothetical protein